MPVITDRPRPAPKLRFGTGLLAGLAVAGVAAAIVAVMRRTPTREETDIHYPSFDDPIDEAMAESFPASDPPSHAATLGARTPV